MINSESVSGVKAGFYLYREKLTNEITAMQDLITDALAEIDADMDFPEEDLQIKSTINVKNALTEVIEKVDKLKSTYRLGRTLKDGVKVGIVGKPNTGKSSLLNALLNYEKAIVSDIAGTTRDIVEGNIDIDGVRFYFSDTAGIRESDDKIEEIGVSLSKRILKESDVILLVVDGSDFGTEDQKIYDIVKGENLIVAQNKLDKNGQRLEIADVCISALQKKNLEELKQLLVQKTVGAGIDLNGDFLCEERHYFALDRANQKFKQALENLDIVPLDILSIDIKDGWDALGEISGKTATEDIINNIFSKFCVGK
jgi:tRNA modification GTPase